MKNLSIKISKLQRQSDVEACARFMADSDPWKTLGASYERAQKVLRDSTREVYVAHIDGEPAGFVTILMQGAITGYIQSICIHPQWRNKGIGKQLIEFAEERIFRDSPNVFLFVSSFNPAAQRFYKRLGYETIGEVKDYIIAGHSEILMRKTIAPLMGFRKKG